MVKLMSSSSHRHKSILSARSAQVMEVEALNNAVNDETSKDDLEKENTIISDNSKIDSKNVSTCHTKIGELRADKREETKRIHICRHHHPHARDLCRQLQRERVARPQRAQGGRPGSHRNCLRKGQGVCAQKNSQVQRKQ